MNPIGREAVVVLGMHRSGTSAVTGILGLAGGGMPLDPMPPEDDNPRGYWESRAVARFNNRLLQAAGSAWNDDAAVPDAWFSDPCREADVEEAASLLAAAYPTASPPVCKDPRFCRLLPLWRRAFAAAGCMPRPVLVVRDPLEVARSLAARAASDRFRPAAVPALPRGLLLWLRYVLDAERHSRDMPRLVVDYAAVLDDWRAALEPLFSRGPLPTPGGDAAARIAAFLDPDLRRQRRSAADSGSEIPPPAAEAARLVHRLLLAPDGDPERLDAVRHDLDRLLTRHADLREGLPPQATADPWAEAVLAELDRLHAHGPPAPRQRRSALFLSGVPESMGHVYRVEHAVAALAAHGWDARWLPLADPAAADAVAGADLVTVFRSPWTEQLAAVQGACRSRRIPLVFDIDDLLFDPQVTAAGGIALLDDAGDEVRREWVARSEEFRRGVESADAALLTTEPLARAARDLGRPAFVLPNALDERMERAAAAAVARPKPSLADGRPRLLFASGTPTHHRDFAVAAAAVARILARRPEPLLVVVGHLDVGIYPPLRPFLDRIERRPPVPLHDLFAEVARGDINLCPLELGNPFCDAKSGIRCLAAAVVEVPSIVSPTPPLRDAIVDGQTGLLADDVDAWERCLEAVLADADLRRRLGRAARLHALARFGFDNWSLLAARTYAAILDEARGPRPG